MAGKLVAEIITIRSLQSLERQIEADISLYESQKEEYSERLGNFLREAEEMYGVESWFKELSLENIGKPRKGDKKKKKGESSGWVLFKSLELSSNIQGEAEIMFETLQLLTEKLEDLRATRETIEELKNVGLGNEVIYNCFMKDGVLSKIVLKTAEEKEPKFTFSQGFSKLQVIQS